MEAPADTYSEQRAPPGAGDQDTRTRPELHCSSARYVADGTRCTASVWRRRPPRRPTSHDVLEGSATRRFHVSLSEIVHVQYRRARATDLRPPERRKVDRTLSKNNHRCYRRAATRVHAAFGRKQQTRMQSAGGPGTVLLDDCSCENCVAHEQCRADCGQTYQFGRCLQLDKDSNLELRNVKDDAPCGCPLDPLSEPSPATSRVCRIQCRTSFVGVLKQDPRR